jgi:phage terminase Nu1 subunit (DNA packaging protein)
MTSEPLPRKATRAEFARLLQRDASWISRLEAADRLVIDSADEMILVAESLALIEDTRGDRADVAERNAELRSEATDPDSTRRRARADAELRIKRAEADRAEMERDRVAGSLIDREDAGYAMRDIGAAIRMNLENFPAQCAPLIAQALAVDRVEDIEAVLEIECRGVLERVAAKLREARLGDGPAK